MEAIIGLAAAYLAQSVPFLTTSPAIGSAIRLAASLLPPAIKLVKDEVPVIKAALATIRGNALTTKEQLDEIDALDAQCDAAFDDALARAESDDAAAGT